jgi:hypothetical protein
MKRCILTSFVLCLGILVCLTIGPASAADKKAKEGQITGTEMPGTPLKVATPAKPLYDAFLRLTISDLDGVMASNSLMSPEICLYP